MADIVSGLFGIDTGAINREAMAGEAARAAQFANLNPQQQGQYGMMLAGQMGGRAVSGLLGAEDPRLQQAKQMEQVKQYIAQNGIDINSPDGLSQAAQFANSIGATQGAMYLGQQAMQMKQTMATTRRTEQQAAREEQKFNLEDQLRSELAALPPDATEQDVINVVQKYGSPDAILKALETKATKLAAEGGLGAGPVGKAGAYRDTAGIVHGAGDMKSVNAEFREGQKLMNELNQITVEDVQNAYSPIGADWTTKGDFTKKLAGAGTVAAQTKIAASKLKQTIENLPPGSASDADMKAAMSSFPGYGDMEALATWVNDTKKKLQFNLDKISQDFGFTATVKANAPINLKGKQERQIVRTGKQGNRKVVQYSDGSVEYAD